MKVTGRTKHNLIVEMSPLEWAQITNNYHSVNYPDCSIGQEAAVKNVLEDREKSRKFDSMLAMLGEFAALAPALQNMVLEGVKKHALQTDKELAS